MNSTLTEVLDAARALSRADRAEIAHQLIASLETTNESDEARYSDLEAAVNLGLDQLDRNEGIEIPVDSLEDYVGELGQIAVRRSH